MSKAMADMRSRIKKLFCPPVDVKGKINYPHVSLYHWQPHDGGINFGDHLSTIIIGKILASRGFTLDDEVTQPANLLGIGSILQVARNGDHVWGSGINGKLKDGGFTATSIHAHAVRGPLTAEFLRKRGINVPDVFGDPALLLKDLFADRFRPTQETDYLFVPNLYDLPLVRNQENLLSPMRGWNYVVAEIMKAKLVLASSLHGLVVAEAFGIPARYVRLSEEENLFKYKDYFYGSGRENMEFEYATSIEQGLEMGGMPPIRFDSSKLLSAFPWHLWK